MAKKDEKQSQAAQKVLEAEKKQQKKQASPKKKKGNIFARMGRAIKKFFKDFRSENKKIIWPGAKMVFKSTGVVLVVVAFAAAVIYAIDYGLATGIRALAELASSMGS